MFSDLQEEELDPELLEYQEQHDVLGNCIRHPLVYSVLHPPQMNGMVNKQLRAKKQALEKALETRSWHSYIYLHERPWRLHALQEISGDIDSPHYWSLLGSIWVDSENI